MNNTKYSLKRLKTEELRNWFNNPRRKPLVLWGARQVGKTVLVENFLNEWLDLGHVVYRSRNLTGRVNIPLQLENERLFRLYLADEGMFTYQAKVKQSDFFVENNRNTLSGVFYESYVADELSAKEIPLFYWTGKQRHEFEFVVENNSKAIAIDVKKNKGKLNSLEDFRNNNGKNTVIKISSNNLGYDSSQDILTLPLYVTFLLADDLSKGEPILDGLNSNH